MPSAGEAGEASAGKAAEPSAGRAGEADAGEAAGASSADEAGEAGAGEAAAAPSESAHTESNGTDRRTCHINVVQCGVSRCTLHYNLETSHSKCICLVV